MDILKVDGVALPAPHSYTVTLNDLDSADTGRTEDGMLVRPVSALSRSLRVTV